MMGKRQKKESLEDFNKTEDPPFSWKSQVFKNEFKTNLKMAFPVLITNALQYLLNIETLSFCGRLTAVEMDSVGLAISIITAFGWCVCIGMVTACDTMFAQAFGSEDKKRTGLFLQRGLLMLNLVPLFLITIHYNMEPILILLGQNGDISKGTGEYLVAFSPGLIFMMNYVLFARFMQDQGCLWPPVIAGLCGNIFNISTQLLFVVYLKLGFKAAAVCHGFSYGIMLACELIYIFKSKFIIKTWPGFQLEAFYDWSQMFKLGLAGVAHVTFEVIVWEANVFLGGIIGPVELATQSIFLQLLNILFVLYYGAGISSNIRVGQCLGANKPNQAKAAYRAGLLNISIAVVILASLVISLRHQIPYIFTDKQDVIDMVIDIFPFLYILFFIDPLTAIFNATLLGCGRQAAGCIITFIGFYLVAIPCNIVLAFVYKFGIKGLWIGTTLGSVTAVCLTCSTLECQNWKKQAALAEQRILYSSVATKIKSKNKEEESLLQPLLMEYTIVHRDATHIRTPSHPVSCATEIVELPSPREHVHRFMVFRKFFIALAVVLLLICGVLIHNFLPIEVYRKVNLSISSP